MRTALREVVLSSGETGIIVERARSEIDNRLDSLTSHLSTTSLGIRDIQKTLQLDPSQYDPRLPPHALFPYNPRFRRGLTECNGLCLCNCHKSRSLNSPRWAQNIIGIILLSWSGVLGHPICNQKRCQRSQNRMLKLNYYFPSWFISRVIYLRHKFETMENHDITLRTPRVVPQNSLMTCTATQGDIGKMQRLFSEGLASPFDVCPMGISSLSVST